METRSNHILVGGVVLGLLAALVAFIVWLSGISGGKTKEYDIFFKQSVEGLAKGSSVSFSGVPSGQIKEIKLWKENPEFVRVRIAVNEELPILIGTTASVQGVGFTGVSQIQLDGAVKGAPPITEIGPAGVPTIPTKAGGLGALLNNAPQLVERLSTLTERLTELLSDKNQESIGNILGNVDRLTDTLASQGPEFKATLAQTRTALKQTGIAAEQIGQLAGSTNALVNDEGRPMVADLRKTVVAAQKSMETLDLALSEARPGLRSLSTQTMPEVNQLVRDLRTMSESLGSVATKLDQGGATALVGAPRLPDYNPPRGDK
jgi:phospholipid/cholesterol/gamma-HCH transport system substrate-binding protein